MKLDMNLGLELTELDRCVCIIVRVEKRLIQT
jgi:hypothetical protein